MPVLCTFSAPDHLQRLHLNATAGNATVVHTAGYLPIDLLTIGAGNTWRIQGGYIYPQSHIVYALYCQIINDVRACWLCVLECVDAMRCARWRVAFRLCVLLPAARPRQLWLSHPLLLCVQGNLVFANADASNFYAIYGANNCRMGARLNNSATGVIRVLKGASSRIAGPNRCVCAALRVVLLCCVVACGAGVRALQQVAI